MGYKRAQGTELRAQGIKRRIKIPGKMTAVFLLKRAEFCIFVLALRILKWMPTEFNRHGGKTMRASEAKNG